MTNITCNIEPFKKYIYDSSAAILSQESNKKHDWKREISCSVGENEHVLNLHSVESSGDNGKFYFFFDIKLFKSSTKTEAKELLCRFADAMQFHPNIKVLDRTEHSSEAIGYHATGKEPIGDDRYFWLRPTKAFDFKRDESGRYCWDEVPEDAYPWFANMVVEVRTTACGFDGWGRSFDLNPDLADPVNFLRQRIRERDEEIARKKAAEEARAEAERSAAERALREQQASYEKLKDFLESIRNFDMNGRLFSECWRPQSCDRSIRLFLAVTAIHEISLNIDDGFDANVKKIIKWMVENGAKEPELKAEAA